MTLLIVLIAVIAAGLISSTTFFVVGRRRRRPEIDAPARRPVAPPPRGRATTAPPAPPRPTRVRASRPRRAPAGPGGPARAPDPTEAGGPTGARGPGEARGPARAPGPARAGAGPARAGAGFARRRRRPTPTAGPAGQGPGAVRRLPRRDPVAGKIDDQTWDDLEEALILADVGVDVTTAALDSLRARTKAEGITSPSALLEALKADLVAKLEGDRELHLDGEGPNVWLFVGVNGVGKTTTIGKLGRRERDRGHTVVMAAGDTFRAAAADQLQLWSERADAELVRGNEGGDPGAVIFDAVAHAAARHADLVLADTAGRLHTKVNLMEELKKVRRVAERPPGHVSEVLLVIDATTGQNGLIQAAQFADAVGVTGVVLTKLDGTAKGGIALAITAGLGIPIKLVGLGEGVEDLVEFDAQEFVDALFDET